MGGAVASNVANAITNVMNDIQNTASASTNQGAQCISEFKINNCHIGGNLDYKSACNIAATSSQIVSLTSQNKLQSVIAQDLLQQAKTLVGSMGIGFASSTNVANALVNSSNSIQNIATGIANQDASSINIIKLQNCDIEGGVDIGVNTDVNFLSSQAVENNSVNDLASNVTQSISQKASATVEGLAGFLIALAILIGVIGYVVFKPVGMVLSNKFIMITLIVVVFAALFITAYLLQWPPFFNTPTDCNNDSVCGTDQCINYQSQQNRILAPPLRYTYNLVGTDSTTPGIGFGQSTPGMVQIVIQSNGGWTLNGYNSIAAKFTGYNSVPNLLKVGGANNYVTNYDTWINFATSNPLYARFVLCDILGIDTSVYIFESEYCRKKDGSVGSPDTTCYKYLPDSGIPQPIQLITALSGSGTVTGNFGVCNFPTYKLQSFMKPWGYLILGLIFAGIIAFIIFYRSGEVPKGSQQTQGGKEQFCGMGVGQSKEQFCGMHLSD